MTKGYAPPHDVPIGIICPGCRAERCPDCAAGHDMESCVVEHVTARGLDDHFSRAYYRAWCDKVSADILAEALGVTEVELHLWLLRKKEAPKLTKGYWTAAEKATLVALLDAGETQKTIARRLGRTQQSVREQIRYHKIPQKSRKSPAAPVRDVLLFGEFRLSPALNRLAGIKLGRANNAQLQSEKPAPFCDETAAADDGAGRQFVQRGRIPRRTPRDGGDPVPGR